METIKGNKLLQDFLFSAYRKKELDIPNVNLLEFHKDWNLMMKIIETIEEIVETKFDENKSYYYTSLATIIVTNNNELLFTHNGHATRHDRLMKNWECCVDFVNWYKDYKIKNKT